MERPTPPGKGPCLTFDGQIVAALLPQRYPIMMLDRILAYYPQERRMIGLKLVSRNEVFLQGHFPGFPILPGVLIIESLAQASAFLLFADVAIGQGTPPEKLVESVLAFPNRLAFLAESKMKHTRPVYPGNQMELESQIVLAREGMYTFKTTAWVNGEEASKGQLVMARLPKG
jgi:3-hydroxyacyl-[acyl-carrier-protein] dehydratase